MKYWLQGSKGNFQNQKTASSFYSELNLNFGTTNTNFLSAETSAYQASGERTITAVVAIRHPYRRREKLSAVSMGETQFSAKLSLIITICRR